MPSIVTHQLFSRDVLDKVKIKNFDLDTYTIFAQSFDMLFYYSFFLPMFGKEERNLANYAHTHEVNNYFKNIISFIIDNKLQDNNYVLGYLYGSICHYVLDSKCHPYIYYFSGDVNQDKTKRGEHERMEVSLDAYMYKYKNNEELYKKRMAKVLFPKVKLNQELINCIDYAFIESFHKDNMGLKFFNSVNTGRFIMKYFVTDRFGIKKQLYRIKDYLFPHKIRKYQYLSFHVKDINEFYLNSKHKKWVYPAMPDKYYTLSFIDLYNESVILASKIINSIDSLFKGKKDLDEVLKLIGNNSYLTGLDVSELHYMVSFYQE